MKKLSILCLTVGLLALGAPALMAQETTNSAPATVHKDGGQRRAYLELIGLKREDLKGLSREDRDAKIKEASQKKLSELQQKQTAGTITDQEKKDMALIEKRLQHVAKPKPAANQ
ncbi:MAG TPA: hypothetical protein VHB20_09760 [Verrucomicrobiae bacterium]|jgi:hypothetical protein|nr:hypothetical protein [Verrucomicrobiae bacterium]